jgi:glycosyltransferase involved in cell wall biosynthesis
MSDLIVESPETGIRRQRKNVHANQSISEEGSIVSVVIPAFNEEGNIGSVLQSAHQALQELGISYEIIVVDGGSTDKTAQIARQHGVNLISNIHNMGKGYSLRRGSQRARGAVVITMDADGSHRPEEIPRLLQPILNNNPAVDVVIGSRFSKGFDRNLGSPLHIMGNRIFNAIIFLLTGKMLKDIQCGFRAFRRKILKELVINESGYEIESEMVVKIFRNNWSFIEMPIICTKRLSGASKLSTFRDGLAILLSIFRSSFY